MGRKGLVCLTLPGNCPSLKGAREGTQAGAWKQDLKENLLAPRLTLRELSYTAQVHTLRDGAAPAGLGPPLSVSNKKRPPQTCPQANLMEVIL